MKRIISAVTLCVALAAISATEKTTPVGLAPKNIVIVLDLSNRLKMKGQVEKDKAIIMSVLDLFATRQKKQGFITSKDKLEVIIAPQPDVPAVTNDKLRIDMTKGDAKTRGRVSYPEFASKRKAFEAELAKVYKEAVQKPQTGADLYSFFCTTLPTQLVKGATPNKVIVLTDGYLLFDKKIEAKKTPCTYMRDLDKMRAVKEDWKKRYKEKKLALCPCQRPIRNTEVLLLETAPKNKGANVYEFDMVEYYWTDWFEKMGVESRIYMQNDKVDAINVEIGTFLGD